MSVQKLVTVHVWQPVPGMDHDPTLTSALQALDAHLASRSWLYTSTELTLTTCYKISSSCLKNTLCPELATSRCFFQRNGLVLGHELRHTLHLSLVWRGSALITTSAGGPQHWMLGLFVLFSQPPSKKQKKGLWCWAPLGMIIRRNDYSCPVSCCLLSPCLL